MQIDYSNPNQIYIGWAVPGTAITDQLWQIRLVQNAASVSGVTVLWADGDNKFDNVWNNRTMLNYA